MIIICAWCNQKIGEKEPYDDTRETHGMCKKCYAKEMANVIRKEKPANKNTCRGRRQF